MGMSTHAVGFRPADDKWDKYKKIWEMCEEQDVEIPDEVLEFFDYEEPSDKPGMEIDLGDACIQWSNEYSKGYEIDVLKLPKDVNIIRVYNSW